MTRLIKEKDYFLSLDWYSESKGSYLIDELKNAGFESEYNYSDWNENDKKYDSGHIYYPNVKEADRNVCSVVGVDYMDEFTQNWIYKTKSDIDMKGQENV